MTESKNKKELMWVYSKPLARNLIENGFECLKVSKDIIRPDFYNWLFEKTDELEKAIETYNKEHNGSLGGNGNV